MSGGDFDGVLDVLRKYFPSSPRLAADRSPELFFHKLAMTRDTYDEAVFNDEQLEHIKNLEKGLRLATDALRKLHPRFARHLESIHQKNVIDRRTFAPRLVTTDRLGKEGKHEVVVHARDLLYRLHYGLLGDWPNPTDARLFPLPRQANAVKNTREKIKSEPGLNAQERAARTQERVIFTHRARDYWETLGGREAPRKRLNPASPFAHFMADLIDAIEEDWKPVPTFNAWRRAVDS